jgi:hypothetical protein
MTEHTPTPWHVDGLYVTNREPPAVRPSIADCGRSPRIGRAEQVANAAFIVKAVNNHEALVDALECAREYIEPDTDWARADRLLKKINDVLAAVGQVGKP